MKSKEFRDYLKECESRYSQIVGLDLAIVTGICVWSPEKRMVAEIKERDPVKQFEIFWSKLDKRKNTLVLIEDLTYFGNRKTVKSLSERIGYFVHTIKYRGMDTHKINLNSARSVFKLKNKKDVFNFFCKKIEGEATDNHTDAVILVEYARHIMYSGCEIDTYKVEK